MDLTTLDSAPQFSRSSDARQIPKDLKCPVDLLELIGKYGDAIKREARDEDRWDRCLSGSLWLEIVAEVERLQGIEFDHMEDA